MTSAESDLSRTVGNTTTEEMTGETLGLVEFFSPHAPTLARRPNAINPGMVETEGFRAAGIGESEWRTKVEQETPLRRIGQPKDIAPTAVFLASDDASWITGENFFIAGGFLGMVPGIRMRSRLSGPGLNRLFAVGMWVVAVFLIVKNTVLAG